MMINEEQRERVREAWRIAANSLSIKIEAPYLLKDQDGNELLCVARLPDFGGPRGMVIGLVWRPLYKPDKQLESAAEAAGLYCSFINPAVYEAYDEEVFREALADWGFFGREDQRPSWLPN